MGWRINLVKNDLTLTPQAAMDVMKASKDGNQVRNVAAVRDDKLYFNPSHLEWMDYVWQPEILDILAKHKLSGEICFSSSEGDNAGKTWGYRFTDGEMTKLTRIKGEWVEAVEGQEAEEMIPTGNRPTDLNNVQIGDTVAVAVIAYGITSYEKGIVGDILPNGAIVVEGREYSAPSFTTGGEMGFRFKLIPIDSEEVQLNEEDETEVEIEGSEAQEPAT